MIFTVMAMVMHVLRRARSSVEGVVVGVVIVVKIPKSMRLKTQTCSISNFQLSSSKQVTCHRATRMLPQHPF